MTIVPSLSRLLRPKTIAYIGGRYAERAVVHCRDLGFEGEIWPVHPERSVVAGHAAVAAVSDLPEAPDAAFVAVNRHASVGIVAELSARGAGGVVCYASGFAEVGDGRLQADLVEAAGDMPLLGPNCYGFINAADGLSLWPDEHGCRRVERGAALVTQSGNMGLNLTMVGRGLEITHMVTLGNAAALSAGRCIDALLDDPRVTAIGLHLEALSDIDWIVKAAQRAWHQGVPIVALKTGASHRGASIISTHTGALAGDAAMWQAICSRYGIESVATIDELVEALTMLTVTGPIPGKRLVSMSCSGGEAALVADRAAHHGVEFATLDPEELRRVAGTLPHLESVTNPLDYHTFIWGDETKLTTTFAAMLSTNCDAGLLVLDMPTRPHNDNESWWAAAHALLDASSMTGRPAVAVATLPDGMPDELADHLRAGQVAPLRGVDASLRALAIASAFGSRPAAPPPAHPMPRSHGRAGHIEEPEAKRLLQRHGVDVPEGGVAASPVDAADALGYPVVIKSVGLTHKSDDGRVGLGLTDAAAVAEWCERVPADQYLVERFVGDAVAELLIGVRSHPHIGILLTISAGGVLTELLRDTAHLLVPAGDGEIAEALQSLRVWKLMNGYRGRPPGDVPAAVECIGRIARLVVAEEDIAEFEVNPLLVRPMGKGTAAVDALGVRAGGW